MDINILIIISGLLASWITILAIMCFELEQIPDKNLVQNKKRNLYRVPN